MESALLFPTTQQWIRGEWLCLVCKCLSHWPGWEFDSAWAWAWSRRPGGAQARDVVRRASVSTTSGAHLRGERPIHWVRRPQQQEAMEGLKARGLGKTRPLCWGRAGDGGSGCSKGSPLGCSLNRENHREESISSLLICEIFQIKNNRRRWRPSLHGLAQQEASSSSSFLPHVPRNKKFSRVGVGGKSCDIGWGFLLKEDSF